MRAWFDEALTLHRRGELDAARERCWIAELDGRPMAFLTASPIPARDAYLIEDLVRDPDAPNGCSELLILELLAALKREGVAWAPGIWWAKSSPDRQTVNATTSQRLTDMGDGPVFYDNQVEIAVVA